MAASEPSPVSDESSSEGSKLRLPQGHDQPMAAMSPRLAILAETSLREHSAAEPFTTTIEPSRMRKRNSTSERRRIRERDLTNASPSQRELVRLLIDQEQEASILRKQLYIANQRVDSEARRAAELERANQLATQRYREIDESRVVVQREASKAIQDSRLYHLELENAQTEIERARESLKHIERERDEAEASAARARAKTRKLREQQIVAAARKEGRRLGFEAGFEHARQERLLIAARPHSAASKRNPRSTSRDVATRPYSPADNASKRNSRRDVVTTPNSPVDSGSRQNLRSSSDVVTKLHFPPDQASRSDSIRNHNPQEENEEALRRSPLLDDLETSPPMSVSDLPIRNLPPIIPSVTSPPVSVNLSRTPLRPFQPPPESTIHESRSHTPTPPTSPRQTIQDQDGPLNLANISPSIQRFPIEIPPQEELTKEEFERKFNTKENPNDIVKQNPQENWVTAEKHREIKGSPPAPYPGPQPPPLLPALHPQSKNVRPAKFPPKVVRFPSLAKTKRQAASWYRSLSFRKKNRPVIDPINEADVSVQNLPTSATNDKDKAPEHNSSSSQSDIDSHYVRPRTSQSWYKKSAPSSVHTTDKRRPVSGVESSPGLSQFELLFTPHVGTSVRSGRKLKEKDSQLSVIKEETPTNDRTAAMRRSSSRMALSSIPHPNFIGMGQKGSYEALSSSPMRRRHPLAIVVPNPDEPLPPPGIAYSQPGPSNLRSQHYSIPHNASQSSDKNSIGIEVVPPSGFAPDPVHSPPHTGRNHLSPYHAFRPTSQPSSSRIIPMPSIKSLQSSGDKHLEPPPPLRIESRSGSRASSRHADNGGLDSVRPRSAASRPQSAMSATPNGKFSVVNKSVEDARSSRSRTPRAHTPMTTTPRATQAHPRPESARSSASKNQLSVLNLDTNQTHLGQQQTPRQQPSSSALNPVSPGHSTSHVSYQDPALHPPVDGDGHHQSQAGLKQNPQQPSSSALNLVSPVRHSTSRVSLREAGSFANGFDDGTYLDPAYYPAVRESNLNVPSRPVSRGSSALSYL